MNKERIFSKELSYILDSRILENAKKLVNMLPDYFFEIPASSTGKYHPAFSNGEGGLLRHTKVAVRILHEILTNESLNTEFTDHQKDLMTLALILHDGCKLGLIKGPYTIANHPLVISNYIKNNQSKLTLTDEEIAFLCSVIETHMGPWNKDYKGNPILPVPATKAQKIIHLCDLLSSKKFLDVKFDNNEIVD